MLTAKELLAEKVGEILTFSSLYQTEPWGFESNNSFLNAVAVMETTLHPFDLLDKTQQIEIQMGRSRKSDGTYQDRIIDIDLLLYSDMILNTANLILPHPLMHERSFVLEPLLEVAPALIHPVFKKSIHQLYQESKRL